MVIGFGQINAEGQVAPELQAVEQTLVSTTTCSQTPLRGLISSDMFCASGADGTGVCFGDSGGPAIIQGASPEDDVLVGLVSWYVFHYCYRKVQLYTLASTLLIRVLP